MFFGGVQDTDLDIADDDSDDEDDTNGNFFNDLYAVNVDNERATWNKIELSGKRDGTKKKVVEKEEEVVEEQVDEKNDGITKVVEDGAFTIVSTVGIEQPASKSESKKDENLEDKFSQMNIFKGPSPRFGSQLAVKQGTLYLFGGMVEDSSDRQLTHKDLYSLGKTLISVPKELVVHIAFFNLSDIHKMDEWETIIESDIKTMEWVDSESSDMSDEDEEESDDEMDTSQ